MGWKEFLRPNKPRIIISAVTLLISLYLFAYTHYYIAPRAYHMSLGFFGPPLYLWEKLMAVMAFLSWPSHFVLGIPAAASGPTPLLSLLAGWYSQASSWWTCWYLLAPFQLVYWYLLSCVAALRYEPKKGGKMEEQKEKIWKKFLKPSKPKMAVFVLISLISVSLLALALHMLSDPSIEPIDSVWNNLATVVVAVLYWPMFVFVEKLLPGIPALSVPDPIPEIINAFLIALPVLLIYWYLLACIIVVLFSRITRIKRREA